MPTGMEWWHFTKKNKGQLSPKISEFLLLFWPIFNALLWDRNYCLLQAICNQLFTKLVIKMDILTERIFVSGAPGLNICACDLWITCTGNLQLPHICNSSPGGCSLLIHLLVRKPRRTCPSFHGSMSQFLLITVLRSLVCTRKALYRHVCR